MVDLEELRDLIDGYYEWLLVRKHARTFALGRDEIELERSDGEASFGFLDDRGFHTWQMVGYASEGGEILIETRQESGGSEEILRLVPRTPAGELAVEIEIARLKIANEIAGLIVNGNPGAKLVRVGLNADNGRVAQIDFDLADRTTMTAVADVTATMNAESSMAGAILRLEKLALRKNRPVGDAWVICEKRQAKDASKLLALLNEKWRLKLTVVERRGKEATAGLNQLPKRNIKDLWREKAGKLTLPASQEISETAEKIIELSPETIDIINSRHGETLRFHGLPFARVRVMPGKETSWFGVGSRQSLTGENWNELTDLIADLNLYRSAETANARHAYYRAAPEAWLESILRRNIGLLDANLILSPLYNQFRSARDKIDLLALRRDGRLGIIELKTQPDREMIFQAADYWRKIELQRRRGILAAADLFEGREIMDEPPLIYLAAPAWSFHRDFEFFARCLDPEIDLWRFELHQNWRRKVRVLARQSYTDARIAEARTK